jgi:hypothetical protein
MLQYSPKIITDSLVMCLDASQNKSYPTDLPVKGGLLLWLDAADDSTFSYSSGNIVSQWRDKSGLNNHSSQATVGNQPSRSTFQNSRKTVNFDGTNDFLDGTSALTLANGYTAFTIVKSSATGERDIITSTTAAQSADIYLYQQASSGKLGNWSNVYTSNPISLNVWYLFSTNVSSVGSETLYLNGSSQTSNSRSLTNTRGYRVGAYYTGSSSGEYWSGEIAEILIFNRALSSTEMKQVHTYLGQKWGISNTDRSIIDLSNNNNNGSFGGASGSQNVANMPLYDFYNKGSLKFDGSNDYSILTSNSFSSFSTFTISIWAYLKTLTTKGMLFKSSKDSANQIIFEIENSQLHWAVRSSNTWSPDGYSSAVVVANTWQNFVVTVDGSGWKLYINGSQNGGSTQTSNFTSIGTTQNYYIGYSPDGFYGDGRPLDGNISNTLIYSRALSATEISQNYEAQKSKFANTIVQQGLVLNLDAGNIYSYAGSGTTFYDVSGNSNNGTLTNGPTYSSDVGGAIVFDGTNDYVSIPDINFTAATIDIWVYINAYDVGGSVFVYQSSSGFEVWSDLNGLIRYNKNPNAGLTSGPGFTLNSWNNIVATSDGTINKLYLNNVNIGSTNGVIFDNTAGDIRISGYGSYMVNGKCAMLKMYNRALSVTEITQNYNATKGRFGL